jgi:myo-inositol-1(or 4)-monophosphatase
MLPRQRRRGRRSAWRAGVTEPAPADLLEIASAAAVAAAGLLASRHGRPGVVATKSSPTDVVTEMDRAAEQLIRGMILAERPGDAILGEEGGLLGEIGQGEGVRWIVDPLDGTVNYLYGLPDWAVSIAAEVAGTAVAGVVCVPRRDSLFSAVLGGGAWQRSMTGAAPPRRLACNAGVPLDRALVGDGLRLRGGAPAGAGPGDQRGAAESARHQARRVLRRGPVLAGRGPA